MNVTNDTGPTVDSRYVEPAVFLTKLSVLAAKFFGFRLRMTVDHIYADRNTASTHISACRILPDRVSDHSPLEVVLSADRSEAD